jgi:hypothetical protein
VSSGLWWWKRHYGVRDTVRGLGGFITENGEVFSDNRVVYFGVPAGSLLLSCDNVCGGVVVLLFAPKRLYCVAVMNVEGPMQK